MTYGGQGRARWLAPIRWACLRALDRRVGYGGSWFVVASALPVDGGFSSPRRRLRLLLVAVAHPWRLIALILVILRTPTLDVALSESAVGQVLREYFDERSLGIVPRKRLCRGVLTLPRRESDYLRGRHRQAVRTNVRRAEMAGIECKTVGCRGDFVHAALHIVHARQGPGAAEDPATLAAGLAPHWRPLLEPPEITLLVARDISGVPLAVAAMLVDDDVSVIRLAVASNHDARWALHHYIVRTLIAHGVTHVLADGGGTFGVLGLASEVQYYQRLQGYEVHHVRRATFRTATPSAGRRRATIHPGS